MAGVRARCNRTRVNREAFIQTHAGDEQALHTTYTQLHKLGEGAYGEVHLVMHKARRASIRGGV